MSVHRLLAIAFIFFCSTLAWLGLGTSVAYRSGMYDSKLEAEVTQLWGGRHVQQAPSAWVREIEVVIETVAERDEGGDPVTREVSREVERWRPVPLDASDIDVTLHLEHRRKGLLWYDLYAVELEARYRITVPEEPVGPMRVTFAFPASEAIYDDFRLRVGGREGNADEGEGAVVVIVDDAAPGEQLPVELAYRSRGLDRWAYAFRDTGVGQVRDFTLRLDTDFTGVDFPPGTLSPTERQPAGSGELITWRFTNLVTGKRIGVDLPDRLNPGPLTQRVTFFAPVSLLFFLAVMVILGVVHDDGLHPMHYFFVAAAFFSFHLLLAYLVDHVSVHLAFALAALVSVFLVVSYLRVVGGTELAVARAGVAQLVYLVLFNYAFFFEGFTGLTITLGAIVTLFVLMQATAHVDWAAVFSRRPATSVAGH